jgi:hypothetical protein
VRFRSDTVNQDLVAWRDLHRPLIVGVIALYGHKQGECDANADCERSDPSEKLHVDSSSPGAEENDTHTDDPKHQKSPVIQRA